MEITMSSTKRVTAIFDNKMQALKAIDRLETVGYSEKNISMLVSENTWKSSKNIEIEKNTKVPTGVATGATAGGLTGAIVAGLTATGAIAITGGAGLLAAGPIVSALAGAGAGGATGGELLDEAGIVGGLIGLGIPEVEAKLVDSELANGNVLLNIETDKDRVDDLKESLDGLEPKNISVS